MFSAAYPAEFQKATIEVHIVPGGTPAQMRNQVRRDATCHLLARHRYMMANIAGFATETVSDISMRATDNPEVQEVLARLAISNASTPYLEPPGPAIGMLKRLLPHPEEWGFEGATSPILPGPAQVSEVKALPTTTPKKK